MKALKRLVAVTALFAMLGSSSVGFTDNCNTCNNSSCEPGVAYYEGYNSSCITPAIGLGVVALAAVIAVAVNNSNRGHGHHHGA